MALPLAACFSPAAELPSFDLVNFENPLVRSSDVVLQPFRWDALRCPDGEPATLFAVYRTGIAEPAPVVIVFHAGAFDYVTPYDSAVDPRDGVHLAGEDRLDSSWASRKVFETFGMLPGVAEDPGEVNAGALPAALADAGAFTLYPANCWGDLWHNEDGYKPNDWSQDAFHRQGRFLAWAATRVVSQSAEESASWRERFGMDALPIELDGSAVSLVGLGDGGRAVPELLRRTQDTNDAYMPPIRSVLLDSTPDELAGVYDPSGYPEYAEGIDRIFFQDASDVNRYSLARWFVQFGVSIPTEAWWSSEDPQLPDVTMTGLSNLATSNPTMVRVENTGELAHVLLNDEDLPAREAVDRLLGTTTAAAP
jgi:hypothetical protein